MAYKVSIKLASKQTDFRVGETVSVKLTLGGGRSRKGVAVRVRCDLWDQDHDLLLTHDKVISSKLIAEGRAEIVVELTPPVRTGVTLGVSRVSAYVSAPPKLQLAREAIDRARRAQSSANEPHGYKVGKTEVVLELLAGTVSERGCKVKVESAAIKRPASLTIKPDDPRPYKVPVELVGAEPSREVDLTLSMVEGGELGGRTSIRVQPLYPEVRLEHDGPTLAARREAAERRWLPGAKVPLNLVCTYPPEEKLRVRLRGESLKGGKKEYVIRANGNATHKITLEVGPDVQDMTDHVQLEKVSGDFLVDATAHEVPVSIGQKLTLSFPSEGWVQPDTRDFTVGQDVTFVVRTDAPVPEPPQDPSAPPSSQAARVHVGYTVVGSEKQKIEIEAGTQEGRTTHRLTAHLKKTQVELELAEPDTYQLGKPNAHTLWVHKANKATFHHAKLGNGAKKLSPKPPYHAGAKVRVPIKLEYPLELTEAQRQELDQDRQQATNEGRDPGVKVGWVVCALFDTGQGAEAVPDDPQGRSGFPVRVGETGQAGEAEVVFGTVTAKGKAKLELVPAAGFYPQGTTPKPDKVEVDVRTARDLSLHPHLFVDDGGQEHEVDDLVIGELVKFRVKVVQPSPNAESPGTLVIATHKRKPSGPGAGYHEARIAIPAIPAQATQVDVPWQSDTWGPPTGGGPPAKVAAGQLFARIELPKGSGGFKVGTKQDRFELTARAKPHVQFASPAVAPDDDAVATPTGAKPAGPGKVGGQQPAPDATTFAVGQQVKLRVQLTGGDVRPPAGGVKVQLTGPALDAAVDVPPFTIASWRDSHADYRDVTVTIKQPPAPPATLVTTATPHHYAAQLQLENLLGLATFAPPPQGTTTTPPSSGTTAPPPAPKLAIKVTEQPRVGLLERGFVLRTRGGQEVEWDGDEPLRFNEPVTIVLETAGAPPSYRFEAELTCPAFANPVKVVYDPATADTLAPGEQVTPRERWEQEHRLRVATTFDARASSNVVLTLAHPVPKPASGLPQNEAWREVQLGRTTRNLRFGKALTLGFVKHKDGAWVHHAVPGAAPGDPPRWVAPAKGVQAGDRVRVRVKLSDLDPVLDRASAIARLKSLAFRPPLPKPGAPKKPAGTAPVPGVEDAVLGGQDLEHDVELTVQVSPPAQLDWTLTLVESGASPYVPVADGSQELRLRVLPLPELTFAPDQPALIKPPEPPPSQTPPPPGAPAVKAADYHATVGATVPLYALISGPIPATGAAFKLGCNPAGLVTVEGTSDNVVEVSRAEYDAGKRQDGSYLHEVRVIFNKKTTPTAPRLPPLPTDPALRAKEEKRRRKIPAWNHLELFVEKNQWDGPRGVVLPLPPTTPTTQPPPDPNAPPTTTAPEPTGPRTTFSVAVAGSSLSFPTDELGWWIKPATWYPDPAGSKQDGFEPWTDEMKGAVLNYLPFSRGDMVTLRLQRNGGTEVHTVAELNAMEPEKGKLYVAADAGTLTRGNVAVGAGDVLKGIEKDGAKGWLLQPEAKAVAELDALVAHVGRTFELTEDGQLERGGLWVKVGDRVQDDGASWKVLPDPTPVRTAAQLEALSPRAGQEFKLKDAGALTRGALQVALGDRVHDDGTSWVKVTGAPALGVKTVAELEALPAAAGQSFELSDAGTLTRGALSVAAGDRVHDDGASWSKIEQADLARLEGFAKTTGAVFRVSDDGTLARGAKAVVAGVWVKFDGTRWIDAPAAVSVEYLDGLTPAAGALYTITDGGLLAHGALVVKPGDGVRYDRLTSEWVLDTAKAVAELDALVAHVGRTFELTEDGQIERGGLWVKVGDRVQDDGTSWKVLPDPTPVRTAAQLEALSPCAGQEFKLKDDGTLTRGALSVAAGDRVHDDGASWTKVTGAPALGVKTVAELEPLRPAAGQEFKLKDGGTLTRGALSVAAGDRVHDDGASWTKIEQADLARLEGFAKATGAVFRVSDEGTLARGAKAVVAGAWVEFDGTRWIDGLAPDAVSVDHLNGLTPTAGAQYTIADGGLLEPGALVVKRRDGVRYDGLTRKWVLDSTVIPAAPLVNPMFEGVCAKVSSYAFGAGPTRGGKGKGKPQKTPKSIEVRWKRNAVVSEPVDVILDPPDDLYLQIQGPKPPALLALINKLAGGLPQEKRAHFPLVPVTISAVPAQRPTPAQKTGETLTAYQARTKPRQTGESEEAYDERRGAWKADPKRPELTHAACKFVAWGAPAPGHERGVQLRAHRTIEWEPTVRKRKKNAFYLGDEVELEAVLNAFALEPIHCVAHSLLFDHEGSYGIPFTIPRGAMSGRVKVALRHATKIKATRLRQEELALIESGAQSTLAPEQGTSKAQVTDAELELGHDVIHLEALSTELCYVAKALDGEVEAFLSLSKKTNAKGKPAKPVYQETGHDSETQDDYDARVTQWQRDLEAWEQQRKKLRPTRHQWETEDAFQTRLALWDGSGVDTSPGQKVGSDVTKRLKKLNRACDLHFEVLLPRVSFDPKAPFKDPPPPTARRKHIGAWFEKKFGKPVTAVLGHMDQVTLSLQLDAPARADAQVRLTCEGFDPEPAKQTIDVPVAEGAVRFEHQVTFANKLARKRVPLTVEGLPRAGTDGVHVLYVTFEDVPAVFLPRQDEELERIDALPEDEDEDDLAGAFGFMFRHPEADEWISPPGPYAHHDKLKVMAFLSEPASEGGAKANLVGDVLDRAYALDFAAGSNHAEVEVELAVKPKSLNQYLRVEAVEGCAAGWRAQRAIEVFAERSVWFPPRACIAPTGPFVKGDHVTLSLMLHPPAPEGGAAVTVKGPFADEAVEFAQGECFRAVTVQLTREAEAPQVVTLAPQRACTRGQYASFEIVVRTPKVEFAPRVLHPEPEARVGEETSVVLRLSHPAPGPKPVDPVALEELREAIAEAQRELRALEQQEPDDEKPDGIELPEDLAEREEQEAELRTRIKTAEEKLEDAKERQEQGWGAAVVLKSEAFAGEGEVVAHFTAGATTATVPVKIKPDETLADTPQKIVIASTDRLAAGTSEVAFTVRRSPFVRFHDDPITPGPGVARGDGSSEVVYRTNETATLRITCEEVPAQDVQVQLTSPAFGGKVYLATLKRPKDEKLGPVKLESTRKDELPVAEVTVTFARGVKDGGGGKPQQKVPIKICTPRGWRPANEDAKRPEGKSTLQVWVLQTTPQEPCPYAKDETTGEVKWEDWVDAFAAPCNLEKVLLVEFHGELAPDPVLEPTPAEPPPDPNAPIDPNQAPPPSGPKAGTRETEMDLAKGMSKLVSAKRGPFELVRDLAFAEHPERALLYKPGEPPVLQVIAGRPSSPNDPAPPDPKFHATHISVQMERAAFCRHTYEELRSIKLVGAAKVIELLRQRVPRQALPLLPPEAATLETLLRHHPLVNLRQRKAGAVGLKKAKGAWKFVYPPIRDVREKVASDADPLFPPFEQLHQGTTPQNEALKPGEDETTQKGYATLATFSVTPQPQLYDLWSQVPVPPETAFGSSLAPIDSALRRAGFGPISGVASPVDKASAALGTTFDPKTGTIGAPISRILEMVGFALTKPKQYLLEVRSCGQPDPDDDAPPCEDLACIIEVYPSDEFNVSYRFKALPDTINIGVEGQYLGSTGELKKQSWDQKGLTTQVYKDGQLVDSQTETPTEPGQDGHDLYAKQQEEQRAQDEQDRQDLARGHQQDRQDEVTSHTNPSGDQTIYSDSQDQHLDLLTDQAQRSSMRNAGVDYREQTTLPTQELVGRYGMPGKLEKPGSIDPTLPADTSVGSLLDYQFREVTQRTKPRDPQQEGVHGSTPPGAPPGWKPPKEPGQPHGFKSKVFTPVGYDATALGPIPAEDRPAPVDHFGEARQICLERVQDQNEWSREHLNRAQTDFEGDVASAEGEASTAAIEANAWKIDEALGHSYAGATIFFTKNGGTDRALQKVADSIGSTLATIRCFTELLRRFGDIEFSFGFSVRFEVAFLEGALTAYWGWKESCEGDYSDPKHAALQKQVFPWYALWVDLILCSLRFMADFGAKFSVGFFRFEAVVYAKIQLDASVKSGFERRGPLDKLPAWCDTWWIAKASCELGVRIVLIHEKVCYANGAGRTGLELKWRFTLPDVKDFTKPERERAESSLGRFGLEYEIHFPGVDAVLTVRLFGANVINKTWTLVEGNPPELPLRRGAWPASAHRTFWNAQAYLKTAWGRLTHQRRRIVRRLDRWQQLQLDMVSHSKQVKPDGSPLYPLTDVAPGYAFAGDPDDKEQRVWWDDNKAKWEQQWAACRASFGRETFKVRTYGAKRKFAPKWAPTVRKHLGERLTYYCGRVEEIFERELFPLMKALDERAALLRDLEKQLTAEQNGADDGQGPSKELLKALKKLDSKDKVLKWRQMGRQRPLTDIDKYLLRIAYYHPQREAW